MKISKFLLITFVIALTFVAQAGVNLKNGNFYMSYTDIIVPGGGHDLIIARTYNSRATDVGWFGFGWGSEFETKLIVDADGSVVIHENGSGARTRFIPKEAIDPKAASKKIVDEMRKKSTLSDKVAADLIKKLTENEELRHSYARRFSVKAKLSKGTILYSSTRGLQQVHVMDGDKGFKRAYNNGKTDYFDQSGKLIKIVDVNGYTVDLNYSKEGTLTSIKDSLAKQLFFEWYPDGKIKHLTSVDKKKCSYKFDGQNLIESQDIENNTVKYSYDPNHNMTEIKYADNTSMKIKYNSKTQFVEQVTERNGDTMKYAYDADPKNPKDHYWTVVTRKEGKRDPVTNRYEYKIATKDDGVRYTKEIYTEIAGQKTRSVYSPVNNLPERIERGSVVTTFNYDAKGLLTEKKSSTGSFVKLSYDKDLNKISRVVNNEGWTNFEYDKKGNLSKAVNNEGTSVLLVYDREGRISKMIDQAGGKEKNKRTLTFKYNTLGKPVEIAMSKMGKINVAYDNYGQIKKVESKQGSQMALQVTKAFQALLSIVKPAGVNLNM